jgi:phage terminase Nu1 subunit (DNA packaging protein)
MPTMTPLRNGRPRIEKADNDAALSQLLGLSVVQLSELVREGIIPPPLGRQYDLPKCVSFYVNWLRKQLDESIPIEGTAEDVGEFLVMTNIGVNKLAREHDMPKLRRGAYPIKECVQWYIRRLRKKANGEEGDGEMATERMLLVREQRLRAEMERHALAKNLVQRNECEAGWVYLSGQFVAAMGSFVARVAAVIGNAESPAEARAILKREETRARNELARGLAGVTADLRGPRLANSEPAAGPLPGPVG